MRIDSVRLANFGSHAARTWEPGSARLSVIVGENGRGKSTLIVDGPLFALFGEVPDGSSPDALVRTGATDMSVALELTLEGTRYRIIRRRTTRSGGKSSADLQEQLLDGTWAPVASGAREVTTAVTRLLRMDQHTFRTAVVLAQRDAWRFMDATAGKGIAQAPGRAAILSTIVVDPVFALVEERGRADARDLEARTIAERGQVERLELAIADLEGATAAKAATEAEIFTLDASIAGDKRRRTAVTERLTILAGEIAKGEAAAAEVARLEEERAALADRYRREKATIVDAEVAIVAADSMAAIATEVEQASHDLPAAKAEVERLETEALTYRALTDELAARREAFAETMRPIEAARTTWETELRSARERVTALVAAVEALEPVICEKCAHPNVVDQADLRGQLRETRANVKQLEKAEPGEPMALSRERVAVKRLQERGAESTWSPAPLTEARARLVALERTAARAGEVEAAARARDAATKAKASAEAELEAIGKAGKDIQERIRVATFKTTGTQALLTEQAALNNEARTLDASIDVVERQRRQAEAALATATANLERQAQLRADVDAVRGRLAAADTELRLLRRLVADAGVKGIPARVVEGVLPELVDHANELLGQLRPGMMLDLRATRAKADGSGTIEALDIWIRDATGERQRWSGGEGTSIAMSIAVALSRLGARRSGARVTTLVIDEPDGLDSPSRRAFGQALRVLAHQGDLERVAVITHQDGIPDFADEVIDLDEPAEEPAVATTAAA